MGVVCIGLYIIVIRIGWVQRGCVCVNGVGCIGLYITVIRIGWVQRGCICVNGGGVGCYWPIYNCY